MEVGVISLNHDGSISEDGDDDVSLESRGTGDREFATIWDISSIGGVEVSSEEGVPFSRAFSEEDEIRLFLALLGIVEAMVALNCLRLTCKGNANNNTRLLLLFYRL
ncbi:hypothetical protein NDU88_004990 [Pleurodeles waltl]|uniref:Uncharacterized protein n=1 Tax=Pleurodeles waltl TaxID=8319 RepID=A0AAV7QG02_PLEWA|nr:hypothetical protein NDU88_004990 [Pleurodeles waltl]